MIDGAAGRMPRVALLHALMLFSGMAGLGYEMALRLVTVPPGGKVLRYVDGVMASVAVVQDASGARHLKIDERFTMGGTATRFSDRRQAHLPLLLHGAPRDALFLGLGTGMTFAAAAEHPDLQATGVELVPEILSLLDLFDPIFADAQGDRARLRVLSADARRYVTATAERYDVIVADLFHPSRDGAGALYTVEHFTAVRDRLRESGLFCQWLPLYQLDLPTLRAIVRTFVAVYPQAQAYLAHYSLGMPILGLIARREPTQYSPGWVARRMQDGRLAEELRGTRLDTDFALFGGLLATAESLRRFAGDGPVNTDDFPLVTFQAPGFVYRAQAPPWQRLLCLLDALSADPAAALALATDASGRALHHRLQRYWTARDAFLRAGVGVVPSDDARALLAQTREPLLRVVRMSEDFDAAYNPLLGMARALFESDPEMTLALLRELESANPAREDARSLRLELFGG